MKSDVGPTIRAEGEAVVAYVGSYPPKDGNGPMLATPKAPLNGRRRAEGLSFRATDGNWHYGTGPEVIGPGIDLV